MFACFTTYHLFQLINWMKLCLENKCVVFPCHKWLFVVDIGTGLPRHNMDQVIKDDDSSWDKCE